MKRVMKKFNRALSIMLVAAMVLTMTPQTAMSVLAAPDEVSDQSGIDVVGETENPAISEQNEGSEGDSITPDMGEKTDPDEGDVLDGENDPDEDIDVPDEGDDLDGGDDPLEGTDPIEGEELPSVDAETSSTLSTMGGEVQPYALSDKKLYPAISKNNKDDGGNVKWSLTKVENLPTDDGKTYLTIGTVGEGENAWDGFVDAKTPSTVYSQVGIAGDDLAGKVLAFGIQAGTGYQISDTNSAGATLADTNIDASKVTKKDNHYEIALDSLGITEDTFGEKESVNLDVWASVEAVQSHTVTVNKSAGIKKATYTTDGTDPTASSTPLDGNLTDVAHNTNLKLYVEGNTGYKVVVKKDGTAVGVSGTANVYDLGKITADTTVAIETEQTHYGVTNTIMRADGETESTIPDAALSAVKIIWGSEVTGTDETDRLIPKNTDLTFKLDGLGKLKADVSYTKDGNPVTPTLKGVTYTVPKEDIAAMGAVTIDVKVRSAKKVAVTMAANTDVKTLTYKNAEGSFVAVDESTQAAEGETFEFKVEANTFFKVTDVKANDGADVPVTKKTEGTGENAVTVYSLVAGTSDITITVETALDEAQCYLLDMVVDGDEGSVTAAVTKADDITDDADGTPGLNATLPAEKALITRNAKVKVVLTVATGYELAETEPVKLGETALPETTAGNKTYHLNLTKGELATLTVKTERASLANDKSVTFDKSAADHMALTVTEVEGKVIKDAQNENKYTLKGGQQVKDLDFTLVANGAYVPTVKYSGTKEVEPKSVAKEAGKTTYTYSLAAALLGDDDTIDITEEESKKTLTVKYDSDSVDVTLKSGNTEVASTPAAGDVTTEVMEGETLTVIAQAKNNCKLDSIKQKVGDGEEDDVPDFKQGSLFYKYDVTLEDDVTVTIKEAKGYEAYITDNSDNALALNRSKKYDVLYDGTYKAYVMEGTAKMKLAAYKVTTKNGDVAPETSEDGTTTVNYTDNGFTAGTSDTLQITLGAGLAGKECTLELYKNEEDATPTAKYALVVSALIKDADVKINNKKAITQSADTAVDYPVVVTKNADVNELKFEIVQTDGADVVKSAAIVNGKLRVTTGFEAGTASLNVYTGTDANKKYIMAGENKLAVSVTTTDMLADTTNQPTVKQASSTDVSLTLSLTEKKAPTPATGKLYYEVKLTPAYDATKHDGKLLSNLPVLYIEKTQDVQEATIYVGAQGNAQNPKYGKGAECQYGVAVKLMHVENASAIPTNGTEIITTNIKSAGKPFTKDASKDFATKDPTFETNLKLKGKTTTVYTTQQDVVVAIPTFSKPTSYTVLPDSATDITPGLTDSEKLQNVTVVNNEVKVSADSDTKLGKHTIQVLAATTDGDTMYASRATIAVTVVRGIEDISLSVPTDAIYYADKAVKVKTAVTYNSIADYANPKDGVPKAKKVTYKLVDASTNKASLDTTEALDGVTEAAVVANGVTIDKNGQISVPKNYKVTAHTFKVLVRAADFAGNTACDLSDPITITRDYMKIARAVIVKSNGEVIASDDAEVVPYITASDLNDARLLALAPGAPVKDSYDGNDITKYWIEDNLSYTSSNKKAVEFSYGEYIKVNGPANKLKLTVAPADGSAADKNLNSTKTITLNVTYDPVTKLGLKVTKLDMGGTPRKEFEPIAEGNIDYSDSSTPMFELELMDDPETDAWDYAPEYTDYKLTVSKGGKILPKEENDGPNFVRIAANDKQTVIKLTYKVKDETNGKMKAVNKEYTLTNTGLTAAVNAKVKAPKITFLNKRSTIQSNYTTTDKTLKVRRDENGDITGYSERYIGFNLQSNGKDYPLDFINGKLLQTGADGKLVKDAEGRPIPVEGSAGDLYVKVDVDWSAMTAKNKTDLGTLAEKMWPGNYQKLNSNGNYGGYVELGFDNDTVFTPGSYKLKVSVGTVEGRTFIPAAQPTAITIKVAKDKKLSFKPTTAYKISATDNGYAVLTGKGDYDSVTFSNVQNDNIKGKENRFKTLFDIAVVDGRQVLKMTEDCFDCYDETGKLKDDYKNDLTGYVTYTAKNQYTDPKDEVTGTVKIKVTLEGMKAIAKYAITNATASKAAGSVANVTVTADKKPVTIAYALVTEVDKATSDVDKWNVVTATGNTDNPWAVSLTPNDSVLNLQQKYSPEKTGKVAVTLRVVPNDSYYKAKIDAVDSDSTLSTPNDKANKKEELIKTYGVELKTTVTLNDLTDAKANKRIAVDKANLKQTFTADYREWANGAESGFYTTDRNYWINVPYTELYDGARNQIKAITTDKVDQVGDGTQEWIFVNKNDEEEAKDNTVLSISLNKDALQTHFSDCYQKKTVNGKTVYQPKAINVKATVYYGGTAQAPAAPSDEIKFTLTMPNAPYFMNAYNEDGTLANSDFDQAVSFIKSKEETISKSIADNMQKYNYYYLQEIANDDEMKTAIKGHVTGHLEDHIRSWVGDDSGIDLDKLQDDMTVDETTNNFKVPTTTEKGLVKVTVPLTNGKKLTEGKKTENVVFTVTLPAFAAKANDVSTAVETFLGQATITNNTTETTLLADLRAYMKENSECDTTNIRYTFETFEMEKATEEAPGSLAVKIVIYDLTSDDVEDTKVTVDKTDDKLPIAKLLGQEAVITAVKKAVGAEAPDGGGTAADTIKTLVVSNNKAKVKQAVLDAAQAAIKDDRYTVAYEKKATTQGTAADDPAPADNDEFDFTPATATTGGTLTFKLRIKKNNANLDEAGTKGLIAVDETVAAIPGLLSLATAADRVNDWITQNTPAEGDDASSSDLNMVLKNDATADGILNAIRTDETNGVPTESRVEISFKENTFAITNATVNKKGSITGIIVLKDTTENAADVEVELNVEIPALPQTEAQAAAAIQEAFETKSAADFGITAATQNEDATVTTAILKAAEESEGLKKDTFDINVKGDAKLAITQATENTVAKATITLVVKAKVNPSINGADCAISIDIPAAAPDTPSTP